MKKATISEYTKVQLADSLFKFMATKPLEKISIKEITDECGFPRSTFYYHFEDIYDLTSWALARKSVEALREGNNGRALLWDNSLLCYFRIAQANNAICSCAINSTGLWRMTEKYCSRSMEMIVPDLQAVLAEEGHRVDEDFLRFITTFYGHALVDVCARWLRDVTKATPEEMTMLLSFIIKDNLIRTLDAASTEHLPSVDFSS